MSISHLIFFTQFILFLLQLRLYWNINSIILFSFNGQWNLVEPLTLSTWIYILKFSTGTFQVDVLSILFSFWTSSETQSRYLLEHCTESSYFSLPRAFHRKKKYLQLSTSTVYLVLISHITYQAHVICYFHWKLAACSPDYGVNDASLQT